MQPGSAERIEYYRQRAESNLAIFDEAPEGIPLLPQHNTFPRKRAMNIDDAIRMLTSDDAAEKIAERILHHEAELAKLKKLARVYTTTSAKTRKRTVAFPSDLEQRVLDLVSKKPQTAKELQSVVGVSYMSIGKMVAGSSRLAKNGRLIVAA